MRVLYLTEESIRFGAPMTRGGAIHVRNVVSGLRDRGHEVSLIDWNSSPQRAYQHSIRPRTRFVDGPLRTLRRALEVGRRFPVDVIVSKTRKTYLPGLAAARVLGVPHVVHVGSLPGAIDDGLMNRLDAASVAARLRAPHDGYFVVCGVIGRALTARGVASERIYDVKNAVDTEEFHPKRSPVWPRALEESVASAGEDFLVGYVGGLYWYKGLSDLAVAVERCDADVTAIVAGDGPERERLERAFGDRGRLLGSLAYGSVPALYGAVDALVLPSYTEGLPRVVLEAQAAGMPVIATRVGGVPEVVTEGETGRLCRPGEPEELAVAIDDLATNPGERERLGANGRRAVVDSFSWERLYDRYERYLGQIVGAG